MATLAQALVASEQIDRINESIAALTNRQAIVAGQGSSLAQLAVAGALAAAIGLNNAQQAALTALLAARQVDLTAAQAVITAFNTANPGTPVNAG